MSRHGSLTSRATSGYAWMMAQTVVGQVVNLGGMIALAWLLVKEDFGLFALAQTVAAAALLLRQLGIRAIVINRMKRYRVWANPAFWLTCTLGIVISGAMAGTAPLIADLYDEPDLTPLILVMSLATLFSAGSIIPEARLQGQMRFRMIASLEFLQTSGVMIATILLAWAGFGALSFVLPRPVMRAIQLVVMLRAARPPLRRTPQLRRWRYLIGDSLRLFVANGSTYATSQLDYVVLGIFHTKAVVGLYFYAFILSQRAMVLLTFNLSKVLFPALATLQDDPRRQVAAFLRTARLLAILGAPACLVQAAIAEPVIDVLLDPEEWAGAAPLVQILSLGTFFRLVGQPALALIKAQERYRVLMRLCAATSICFLACVAIGARLGEARETAIAVTIYMIVVGPIQMLVATRPGGAGLADIARTLVTPLATAACTIGPVWWATTLLPDTLGGAIAQAMLVPIVGGGLYLVAIRFVAPADTRDLFGRVRDLAGRIRPGRRQTS